MLFSAFLKFFIRSFGASCINFTSDVAANRLTATQEGGGGEVSPRKSVVESACQYDVTSLVSDFQNGEQSVHRRDG